MSSAIIAQNKINFEVSFTEPQAHYAEVQMNISGLKAPFIDLKMPVWTPGSYLIREFFTSGVLDKWKMVFLKMYIFPFWGRFQCIITTQLLFGYQTNKVKYFISIFFIFKKLI
jgi:hypothetical protein